MRVTASRGVAGSSNVLEVEEYGNLQEGLQFVSARSLGFHVNVVRQF
jgi:hypothetical protein